MFGRSVLFGLKISVGHFSLRFCSGLAACLGFVSGSGLIFALYVGSVVDCWVSAFFGRNVLYLFGA